MVALADERDASARTRHEELMKLTAVSNEVNPPLPPLTLLLQDCASDRRLYAIRAWRVTAAITGCGRKQAYKIMRQTVQWSCARPQAPGLITFGWLLNETTKKRRIAAWIMAIAFYQGWSPNQPDSWSVTRPAR